jgi:hypothetical protein
MNQLWSELSVFQHREVPKGLQVQCIGKEAFAHVCVLEKAVNSVSDARYSLAPRPATDVKSVSNKLSAR